MTTLAYYKFMRPQLKQEVLWFQRIEILFEAKARRCQFFMCPKTTVLHPEQSLSIRELLLIQDGNVVVCLRDSFTGEHYSGGNPLSFRQRTANKWLPIYYLRNYVYAL